MIDNKTSMIDRLNAARRDAKACISVTQEELGFLELGLLSADDMKAMALELRQNFDKATSPEDKLFAVQSLTALSRHVLERRQAIDADQETERPSVGILRLDINQ